MAARPKSLGSGMVVKLRRLSHAKPMYWVKKNIVKKEKKRREKK
jgi:hypothetical protein